MDNYIDFQQAIVKTKVETWLKSLTEPSRLRIVAHFSIGSPETLHYRIYNSYSEVAKFKK